MPTGSCTLIDMRTQLSNELSEASRREFLLRGGAGFGALALTGMLARDQAFAATNPHAAKQPHFAPTAKRVIFLFMEGGPSHMDLFDPKPLIQKLAGQRMPDSFKRPITAMGESESPILASQRQWKRHGQSGLWISDWLPHTAECADDLAVIRSCWTNGINHSGGVCQMNTGQPLGGRPSLGSWVNYGLGTENANLPGFVVMTDTTGTVTNGPRNWSAGFMPATHQGVKLNPGMSPIRHLNLPKGVTPETRRRQLEMLRQLNEQHLKSREGQSELEARIRAYELAYRMQASAPEAVDLSKETEATKKLYGFGNKDTEPFGRCCLMARRLVERGVRFIQIYSGGNHNDANWDAHGDLEKNHNYHAGNTDQPIAGLLKDLEQRGLLDETLIVWGGEFGRQPTAEYAKGTGRDHNSYGFTMWMAGGGIKGGISVGKTDELGAAAVEDRFHVKNLHATVLTQLGFDPNELSYFYRGLDQRLVGVEGAEPIKQII